MNKRGKTVRIDKELDKLIIKEKECLRNEDIEIGYREASRRLAKKLQFAKHEKFKVNL